MNAVTLHYTQELADTDTLVNRAWPGFVATDCNVFRGARSLQAGAATAIRLATLPDGGPIGGFVADARVFPW